MFSDESPSFGDLGAILDNLEAQEETMQTPDAPELTESLQEHIRNPQLIQDFIEEIDKVDEYAWTRGEMGLDFGMEFLNKAFRGFNPGLHLVAGGANTGRH